MKLEEWLYRREEVKEPRSPEAETPLGRGASQKY